MLIPRPGGQHHVSRLEVERLAGLGIQESNEFDASVRTHRELETALEVDLQTPVPVLGGEQAQHALWLDDLFIDTGNGPVP